MVPSRESADAEDPGRETWGESGSGHSLVGNEYRKSNRGFQGHRVDVQGVVKFNENAVSVKIRRTLINGRNNRLRPL